MPEAIATLSTGVDIAYDTHGDPVDRPLLLVMGLGGPLIWWDQVCGEQLVKRGFYVIRFDNRDVGRSTLFEDRGGSRGQVVRAFLGDRRHAAYSMADLADDAFALLDHLRVDAAHLVGASMGGFIVQTMAIAHPKRALSLTSIMSSTGRRTVGWQDPRLIRLLLSRRATSLDEYLQNSQRLWRAIGSPAYPIDLPANRGRAVETFDRGISAAGVTRQTLAILAQPDRTAALRRLDVPALVVHGLADRMVHPSGGRATAAAIPGAELLLIPGMGHDLPVQVWPTILDAIARTAERAEAASGAS
jgi:pimeloyl-ACP methyl ester carboxylesterase